MSNHFLLIVLGLFVISGQIKAQQQPILLAQNTAVNFELHETLQRDEVLIGKLLMLSVVEDVEVEQQIVIATGATGYGRIRSIVPGPEGTEDGFLLEPVSCFTVDGQFLNVQGESYTFVFDPLENRFEPSNNAIMTAKTINKLMVTITPTVVVDTLNNSEQVEVVPSPTDPSPVETLSAPSARVLLTEGIEVPLIMSDECIPSELNVGQMIKLRVKQDVIEHGKLVFAARSPALGKIKHLTDNKIYIEAVTAVAVDGQQVAVETDRSIVVEFDPELEDEVLYLEAEIPALTAMRVEIATR
jgi:hypothetical protein